MKCPWRSEGVTGSPRTVVIVVMLWVLRTKPLSSVRKATDESFQTPT